MKKIKEFLKNYNDDYFYTATFMIVFVISALINSTMLRFFTIQNYFGWQAFVSDLAILIVLSSFAFLIKPKRRVIYIMFMSIFTTALCIINSIYYTFYTSFSSFSMLATSTQVVDVGDAVVKNVLQLKDFTFLWQPIFVYYMYIVLLKKNHFRNEKNEYRKTNFISTMAVAIILLMMISTTYSKLDWGRYAKLWNREFVVMKYGLYSYHFNDFLNSIEPKLNNIFGHDQALKQVSDYYSNREYDNSENRYSDIFKGKNIIMIHAESIQDIALNRSFNGLEVTPFLNKIASEGMYFSRFYAQVGIGTSSDSEFTLSTSLMPSSNGSVFVSYFDREYESYQQLLNDQGYYGFSMHGNTGDFWNRLVMHKNLGYSKFYHKSYFDIDEKIGLGLSDKSFFRQAIGYIKEEVNAGHTPFYSTYIMLSNHTPFDDLKLIDEFPVDYKIEIDGELVSRSYLENTVLGNYFKTVHYADQAIEQFITDLDKEGLLDNSVVILYGDHDARMTKRELSIMYNYDPYQDRLLTDEDEGFTLVDYYKYELERRVPFIIWTKDQQFNLEVDEPMGMIDITPTLANLFGFETKYSLGHDIFNVEDNMVVFSNGNFLTKKLYYNVQKEEAFLFESVIPDNYIKEHLDTANELIETSNNIINYDLIKEMEEKNNEK